MNMTTSMMGMNMPMNVTYTTNSWYVEGVGIVKTQVTGVPGSGDHVTELVSFTRP